LYDLDDVAVLHGPAYAQIAGQRYSRWTHRIIPRVWGRYRAEAVQIHPGPALMGGAGEFSRIALWRFRAVPSGMGGTLVEGLRRIFEDAAETAQLRVFKADPQGDSADYLGIVELHAPF